MTACKTHNNSGQLNLNILLLGAGGQLGFDLEHELTEIGSVFKPLHRELDITHEESLKVSFRGLPRRHSKCGSLHGS